MKQSAPFPFFAVATDAGNGQFIQFESATGSVTYRPNANFEGLDSFILYRLGLGSSISAASSDNLRYAWANPFRGLPPV